MTHLKVGNAAPQFSGIDQHGATIDLKELKGRKLILYFYPKDSTPGCTAEACNLRDNEGFWKNQGYTIIGVSADSASSHKKISTKYELPFSLIADTDKKICHAYGVWGMKKMMGREYEGIYRTTFVLSEEGIITHIFEKVETKTHTEQIQKELGID